MNLKLVEHTEAKIRNEQLPNSRLRQPPHLMNAPVPVIEVTNDADTRRMRRPHRKRDAFHGPDLRHVRAEFVVDLFVPALGEQMQVQLADRRWKTVRVANRNLFIAAMDVQLVSRNLLDTWDEDLKQSSGVGLLECQRLSAADDGFDAFGVRPEDTNYQAAVL